VKSTGEKRTPPIPENSGKENGRGHAPVLTRSPLENARKTRRYRLLRYSALHNSMHRRTWQDSAMGSAK
jgi:hypothetical protein